MRRVSALASAVVFGLTVGFVMPVGQAAAQSTVSASVSGTVQTSGGANVASGASLKVGDTVSTGAGSSVTLLLRDRTALTAGPNAVVKVASAGSGLGATTLDVAKGGFRMITGTQDPTTYKIKTPQATLGVRGTIIEGFVDDALGIEVFVLIEGAFQVCTVQGCSDVTQPGQFIVVKPGGVVEGPSPWPGTLLIIDASLNLSQTFIDIVRKGGGDVLPNFRALHDPFTGTNFDKRFPPKTSIPPSCMYGCGNN